MVVRAPFLSIAEENVGGDKLYITQATVSNYKPIKEDMEMGYLIKCTE